MQTLQSLKDVASEIQYKDWIIRVDQKNDVPFLQILFNDTCLVTGQKSIQRCRKWTLSYFMVNSEVVRTAHKAILAAVEHEVNESFKYKDQKIYHPHHDLDALAEFCKKRKISVREHQG